MIDLDGLTYQMQPEVKSYTGIPQLVTKEQGASKGDLIYPRIMWKWIVRYSPEARQSMVAQYETVESDEEEFEKDIEYTYVLNPTATLSIQAFGDDVQSYINKARQWFLMPKLGKRFLNQYGNVVINDITETQDRKTFFETEYEERPGFDVIFSFNETVKAREKTIEKVTLRNKEDGSTNEIDL